MQTRLEGRIGWGVAMTLSAALLLLVGAARHRASNRLAALERKAR